MRDDIKGMNVSSKGVSVLKIANVSDSVVVSAGGPPIGGSIPATTFSATS